MKLYPVGKAAVKPDQGGGQSERKVKKKKGMGNNLTWSRSTWTDWQAEEIFPPSLTKTQPMESRSNLSACFQSKGSTGQWQYRSPHLGTVFVP